MKTIIQKLEKPEFKPVTISLVFETQKELDAFGVLCNTALISDTIQKIGGKLPEYYEMEEAGANVDDTDELHNLIKNHWSMKQTNL